MTTREDPHLTAWDEETNGPDHKARLEKLLIAVGDWLGHEAEEVRAHRTSRVTRIQALYDEYGGRDLNTKAFWDHVKEISDQVRAKR